MRIGMRQLARRAIAAGVAVVAVVAMAACTGRGGGYLPPGPGAAGPSNPTVFTGQASFGFSFSCQDPGGVNPPTGRLHIELAYNDHGKSPFVRAPFTIHGTVDQLDPVLESAICIGTNPPPGGNELIFLGRFRSVTSPPPGFPRSCAASTSSTAPSCRFEVIVRDNDGNLAPSQRDFFSIRLSSSTEVTSDLDPLSVFYARAGLLAGGNVIVD
jgi:predicted small lipoprotein YifL